MPSFSSTREQQPRSLGREPPPVPGRVHHEADLALPVETAHEGQREVADELAGLAHDDGGAQPVAVLRKTAVPALLLDQRAHLVTRRRVLVQVADDPRIRMISSIGSRSPG